MSLPDFRDDGWLPEGHHSATWEELSLRFGDQPGTQRANVLSSLLRWRDDARAIGLSGRLLIDGSFISQKQNPGDFDLIFIYDTPSKQLIETDILARRLTGFAWCKSEYGGDIFIFWEENVRNFPAFCDINMFDTIKWTNIKKGVVEVSL